MAQTEQVHPDRARRRGRGPGRLALQLLGVAALLVGSLAACASDDDDDAPPSATTSTSSANSTTTTTVPGGAVVAAPPGRLPAVDVTPEIRALFPTPFPATDALPLATETTVRLRASFAATGFSADVRGASLIGLDRAGRPSGSVMAYVIEVRNQEASGDDSTPGYDLIVTLERADTGAWSITKAERQRICARGVTTANGQPTCA